LSIPVELKLKLPPNVSLDAALNDGRPREVILKELELLINGVKRRVAADDERSLLSVLREELDLTGTKYGCGEGRCGACTVLLDGQPVRSCRTPAGTVAGRQVTTVEGLERDGRLHPLQEAFIEAGAMQCGYCIAGMIMSGVGLLEKNPRPTEEEIVRAMTGNVCRCGTYPRVVAAIRLAAGTVNTKAQSGGVK
jgi:aerobic-type carbon monoxide dehydrogenase small subunit (CoxS/CutS family)